MMRLVRVSDCDTISVVASDVHSLTSTPCSRLSSPQPQCAWRTQPSTHIYSYAFALEAATWQPTSTLNFSRLDHVSLGLTYAPGIKASELFTVNEVSTTGVLACMWLVQCPWDELIKSLTLVPLLFPRRSLPAALQPPAHQG